MIRYELLIAIRQNITLKMTHLFKVKLVSTLALCVFTCREWCCASPLTQGNMESEAALSPSGTVTRVHQQLHLQWRFSPVGYTSGSPPQTHTHVQRMCRGRGGNQRHERPSARTKYKSGRVCQKHCFRFFLVSCLF